MHSHVPVFGAAARRFASILGASFFFAAAPLPAATYLVTRLDDVGPPESGNTNDLRWAIVQANANPGSEVQILGLGAFITLQTFLPLITTNMTITSVGNATISGNNLHRILFVDAPGANGITISNLTLANGRARGGNGGLGGGGGGLGAGGALFVNAGAVTVSNVTFSGNAAVGGQGGGGGVIAGDMSLGGGGGGGLGGDGGAGNEITGAGGGGFGGNGGHADGILPNRPAAGGGGGLRGAGGLGDSISNGTFAGGGGGGTVSPGGNAFDSAPGSGGASGGGRGYDARGATSSAQDGGVGGGGGGGGGKVGFQNAPHRGGNGGRMGGGGGSIQYVEGDNRGGDGGEFGGGGGDQNLGGRSGNGGWGGGGGGPAGATDGGNVGKAGDGGYGGGAAGSHFGGTRAGAPGTFGGAGGRTQMDNYVGGGGGGGALGGAVFIRPGNGASANLVDCTFDAGTVTAGAGGFTEPNPNSTIDVLAQPGSAVASSIFIGEAALQLSGTSTKTILGSLGGDPASPAGLQKNGSGTLTLGGSSVLPAGATVTDGLLVFAGTTHTLNSLRVHAGTTRVTGSLATTQTSFIGNAGGGGTVEVSGASALWNSSTIDIAVGGNAPGTLNLFSGARVQATFSLIGRPGAAGAVNVSGSGSQFTLSGGAVYGREGAGGTGSLTVFGGGTVSNAEAIFGRETGSSGTARVGDAGSTWTSNGTLTLGDQGSGTLTLESNGTVTANAIVLGASGAGSGTFNFGAAEGSPAAGTGTLNTPSLTGGTGSGSKRVQFNLLGSVTLGANLTGTLALRQSAGSVILTGTNTFTGGSTILGGTLQIGNGGTVGSLSGNISNAGAVAFNRSDALSYGGVISGTGTLTKAGAGTLTLSAAQTYAGATTVSGGTLVFQDALASSAFSLAAGAVLELNVASGTRDLGATAFSGSGTLRKTGPGAVRWPAPVASFALGSAGLIDVQAGVLIGGSFGNEDWTGNLASLQVATGAVFSGVEANVRVGALTGNGTISSGFSGAGYQNFTFGLGNASGTFAGTLSDNGGLGTFVKAGTGTQKFTGPATGTFILSGGTLQVGDNTTTGSLAGSVVNNASLAFARSDTLTFGSGISGTGSLSQSFGTLILTADNSYAGGTSILSGTLQLGSGGTSGAISGNVANAGVLAFNRSDAVTFAGAVSGAGALTKTGGTLTLTGTNTYTGGTTVSAGTLQIGNNGTSGSLTGNISNAGLVYFRRSDALTYGGVISGAGSLLQGGGGTLTLTANQTYSGGTSTDTNSTLELGNGGTTGAILGNVTNDGTLAFRRSNTYTFAGNISGPNGSVAQHGTGTTILTGTNTYGTLGGTTTITAGTLQVGNGGTTGSLGTGSSAIANAGTLSFNRSDALTFGRVIEGTGALRKLGANTLTLTGANTYSGGTTISAGTLQIGQDSGVNGSIVGNVANAGTLAFARSDAQVFAGDISGTGLLRQSFGTLTLTGTNTHTGGTTIVSGTLELGNGGTAGTLAGNVANSGTLAFRRSDALGFGGNISGSGGLTQAGSGTTTLTGTNSYAGPTALNAGVLSIDGASRVGGLGAAFTFNGGTLLYGGANATFTSAFSLGTNGGTFEVVDTVTFAAGSTGIGNLTKTGLGELRLQGASAFNLGQLRHSAGTVRLNGTVNSALATVGFTAGSSATLLLESGTWTLSGNLAVGVSGPGTLTLSPNTSVSAVGGSIGRPGGPGLVTVTGPNAAYAHSAGLTVGLTGVGATGTLQLLSGGVASSTTGTLASITGSLGDVVISGPGSAWNASSTFQVGGAGTGTLTLTDAGALNLLPGTGLLTLGNSGTAAGTLNFGAAEGSAAAAAGVLNANTVNAGSGSGAKRVQFNHNGTLTLAQTLGGNGLALRHSAGLTILTGAASPASTTILGGTLQIGNGGTSGLLSGSVANSGALVFQRSDTATFGGVVTGAGTLRQTGSGTLTLSGANSAVTGTLHAAAGTLALAGTWAGGGLVESGGRLTLAGGTLGSALASHTVRAGGVLDGTGTLSGIALVEGTLQADGPGQTLTAASDLNVTIAAGGVLRAVRGGVVDFHDANALVNNGTVDLISGSILLPTNFVNNGVLLDSRVVKVKTASRAGQTVTVKIDSHTGHNYQLQVSTDLSGTTFANLGAPQAGVTGLELTFTDPAASGSHGFYRVAVD